LATLGNLFGADWPAFYRYTQHRSLGDGLDGAAEPHLRRQPATGQRARTQWFDTTAFVVPACICFGSSGRDILRGPGFIDLDFAILRDFHFAERFRAQFRAESFNLMNHPNFGILNSSVGSPQVGTITTTINPERQNQLALKFFF
jgi:hypothetical protein